MPNINLDKIEEKQIGDWSTVSELLDYAIVRTAPRGLIGTPMADVLFTYKLKSGQSEANQKRLHLYGPEELVFRRSLEIIERKKNEQARAQMHNEFVEKFNTSKFAAVQELDTKPGTLLGRKIQSTGLSARSFAEKTGIRAPSLYHHVSGGRDISRDIAIEYAQKLNCDPVDLMFEKKSIPVWSKCDLLKNTELEDDYRPGRLFSYAADEKLERVIVPRDIWRSDIKAIKVEARGSMYHNKVAFYYRAENKEQNYLNQLCVVGVEAPTGPIEFTDDTEERFYFGTYEEVRGKSNLINPDPYADTERKFILKDFKPKFIAPIVVLLNPEAVVDKTQLSNAIPDSALVRKEEELKSQIDFYKSMMKKEIEHRAEAMKYAEHLSKREKDTKKELEQAHKKAEAQVKQLMEEVNKITKKIEDETALSKRTLLDRLFVAKESFIEPSRQNLKIVKGGRK